MTGEDKEPSPVFAEEAQGFRPLRQATQGSAPRPRQPFEKGWTESFSFCFIPQKSVMNQKNCKIVSFYFHYLLYCAHNGKMIRNIMEKKKS